MKSRLILLAALIPVGAGIHHLGKTPMIGRARLGNGTFLVLEALTPSDVAYRRQSWWSAAWTRLTTHAPPGSNASTLVVWTSLQDPSGKPLVRGSPVQRWSGWAQAEDSHGCKFDRRGWVHSGSSSKPAMGLLTTFPRGEKPSKLILKRPGEPEAVASFTVAIRARPTESSWNEDVAKKEVPGQSTEFIGLRTSLSWDEVCRRLPAAARGRKARVESDWGLLRQARKSDVKPSDLRWSLAEYRTTATAVSRGWTLDSVRVGDATGNRASFVADLDLLGDRGAAGRPSWVAFPEVLCREEPLWSVALEFGYHGPLLADSAPLKGAVRQIVVPFKGGVRHSSTDFRAGGAVLRYLGVAAAGGSMTSEPAEFRRTPRAIFELPQRETPLLTAQVRARQAGGNWYLCQRVPAEEVNGRPTLAFALRPTEMGKELELSVAAWPVRTFTFRARPAS